MMLPLNCLLLLGAALVVEAGPACRHRHKKGGYGAVSGSNSTSLVSPMSQCGGQNWSGSTTCVDGYSCVNQGTWSQCIPAAQASGQNSTSTITVTSTSTSTSSSSTDSASASDATSATDSLVPITAGYYAQPTGKRMSDGSSSSTSTSTSSSSSTSSSTSTSSSSTSSSQPTSPAYKGTGLSMSASFTGYGGCRSANACSMATTGYTAAISQWVFGGTYKGPACGTCYEITGEKDSQGRAWPGGPKTITVMIDNLCPADAGNEKCAQSNGSLNSLGMQVNFDLCSDSGAPAAFWPDGQIGLATGSVRQVACTSANQITGSM